MPRALSYATCRFDVGFRKEIAIRAHHDIHFLLPGVTFPGVLPSLRRPLFPIRVCAGMRRGILGNDPAPPLVAGVAGA